MGISEFDKAVDVLQMALLDYTRLLEYVNVRIDDNQENCFANCMDCKVCKDLLRDKARYERMIADCKSNIGQLSYFKILYGGEL